MVDGQKAFSLISSRNHCQRSSPSRIFDTPRSGFEPAQNLSSGSVQLSCAVAITDLYEDLAVSSMSNEIVFYALFVRGHYGFIKACILYLFFLKNKFFVFLYFVSFACFVLNSKSLFIIHTYSVILLSPKLMNQNILHWGSDFLKNISFIKKQVGHQKLKLIQKV